jgi:DNA-binding beta-propeller fold protein YncE/mono/diheme cytochrome c family protein
MTLARTSRRFGHWFFGAISGLAGVGCGGHEVSPTTQSDIAHTALSQKCTPSSGATALKPLGARGTGSSVALAGFSGRTLALVADEDDHAIQIVDLDRNVRIARTETGGVPGQVLVLSDGRVLVTLTDENRVAVFEAAPGNVPSLSPRCSAGTDVEPVGIAATPDESTVLVTSRTGRTVAFYATTTMIRTGETEVPRDPYAVTVSGDGRTAFITHVAGSRITTVSLDDRARSKELTIEGQPDPVLVRQIRQLEANLVKSGQTKLEATRIALESTLRSKRKSVQGFSVARSDKLGRVYAPMVLAEPGDPAQRTAGYGAGAQASEVQAIAVLDAATGEPMTSSLEAPDARGWRASFDDVADRPPCLLPRATAVDDEHQALLVACPGIDSVVAFDLASAAPGSAEIWRFRVASGPTGVAIDGSHGRAVVWSSFDRVLSTIPLIPRKEDTDRTPRAAEVALPSSKEHTVPADVALGRLLFHSSADPRVAEDGRGCASCHPSGRDDGLVWSTPRGPRRTKLLAGMLSGTAPYSWDGVTPDLDAHVDQAFERLRGKGGLRPFERRALLRYLESLPLPPQRQESVTLVERGRLVFASAEAGCAGCHNDAQLTDGARHDVKSHTDADAPASFDTPSLRRVASRAPYFHDGRYATLDALISGVSGTMGKTDHLSADDKKALAAYLRSL